MMNLQEYIRRILKKVAKKLSNKLHCDRHGSCVHFAELFVEEINNTHPELLNDFDVIEGYVDVKFGEGIPQEHTWIKLSNDEVIDPTFIQFTKYDENAKYSRKRAKSYTGQEYYDEGVKGSWFSKRREEQPDTVFKGELQESIRRILKEETELPTYFKRRIDFEILEQIYEYVLKIASKRYTDKKKHLNAMTPYKFNHIVISDLIEEVSENFELIWDDDGERFNQLWDFLNDRYSKRNIKQFYEIR
jgi:hypothetical protein